MVRTPRVWATWSLVALVLLGGTLPAGALLVHSHGSEGYHAHALPFLASEAGLERSQAHHDRRPDHGHPVASHDHAAGHAHSHAHGRGHGHGHPHPPGHPPEYVHGHVLQGIALDVPAPPPAPSRTLLGSLLNARQLSSTQTPLPGLDLHANPRLPDVRPLRGKRVHGRASGAARVLATSHAFLI